MTDNTHKARSLILAALMVFSVFAGTVAFAGTAAASGASLDASSTASSADSSSTGTVQNITITDTNTSNNEQVIVDNISVSQQSGALTAADFQKAQLVIGGTTIAENASFNSLDSVMFESFSSAGSSSSNSDQEDPGSDAELVLDTGASEEIEVRFQFTSSAEAQGDEMTVTTTVNLMNYSSANSGETFSGDYSATTQESAAFALGSLDSGTSTPTPTPTPTDPVTSPNATVTFNEQLTGGASVTVASADLSDGGFVVVHNESGDVIGHSEYLASGEHSDIMVTLDSDISEEQSLKAMAHKDANDNQAYDAGTDGAYTEDGSNVADSATVTVAEALLDSGSTYWEGQSLQLEGFDGDADETYQVRSVNSDGGVGGLETEFTLDSSGQATISTSDLDGDYVVVDSNGDAVEFVDGQATSTVSNENATDVSWEVATQSLDIEFAEDSVDNAGDTVETDLEFDSNRGSYDVEITGEVDGESLTDDELTDIFGSSYVSATSDDSVEHNGVSPDDSLTANFSGMDAGEYNFTVSVKDTDATATTSITVNDLGAGSVDFTRSTTEVNRGDIGEITVEFSGAASSGTLLVGDETEDGYQANISITDGNDDGEVTVEFNTYTAGDSEKGWTVVQPADSEDTAELSDETNLGSILESGDYTMSVSTSSSVETTAESPGDLSTFYIAERMTTGAELWTAPGSTSASNLLDAVSTDDTIVESDWAVVQLSASGLEGLVESEGGLEAALDNGSIGMAAEQVNPGSNRAPKTLDVNNTEFETIADADNSTYYVAFQPKDASFERDGKSASLAAGDEFNVSVSVQDDRLLGDDSDDAHETVYHNFEIVSPSVELDSTPVEVGAAESQNVTGTSTLAAGSEFTVRLRSSGDTEPRFFKTASATVAEDGTWTATFDFSDTSAGDTFTVSSSGQSPADALSADGEVVEDAGGSDGTPAEGDDTPTPTEGDSTPTPTEGDSTPTPTEGDSESTPTPDEGTEPSEDTTTTTTPGFGVAVALVALLAAALLAGRRE